MPNSSTSPGPLRAVIYIREGTDMPADVQRQRCSRHADARGYPVAGYASDTVDTVDGYRDACRMIVDGDADLIVVAPGVTVPSPCPIEVAGEDQDGARRPRLI